MTSWIDLALARDEPELSAAIAVLRDDDVNLARDEIAAFLGLDGNALRRALLRIMVERVRPFMLPRDLWTREPDSSAPFEEPARAHLGKLGAIVTAERLRRMADLYGRFTQRRDAHVSEALLSRQDFRCTVCGLAWHNEELEDVGFESPFGYRSRPKNDPLKPHWRSPRSRVPRLDHVWPIDLYGDNDTSNVQAICDCCNVGKAKFMSVFQTRPYTGLPDRDGFRGTLRTVTAELFYTQVIREPVCAITGRTARQAELTVELRDPEYPVVLDNLRTIESAEPTA